MRDLLEGTITRNTIIIGAACGRGVGVTFNRRKATDGVGFI